jgi:hypothetical protein
MGRLGSNPEISSRVNAPAQKVVRAACWKLNFGLIAKIYKEFIIIYLFNAIKS